MHYTPYRIYGTIHHTNVCCGTLEQETTCIVAIYWVGTYNIIIATQHMIIIIIKSYETTFRRDNDKIIIITILLSFSSYAVCNN